MRALCSIIAGVGATLALVAFVGMSLVPAGTLPAETRSVFLALWLSFSGAHLMLHRGTRFRSLAPLGALIGGVGVLILFVSVSTWR